MLHRFWNTFWSSMKNSVSAYIMKSFLITEVLHGLWKSFQLSKENNFTTLIMKTFPSSNRNSYVAWIIGKFLPKYRIQWWSTGNWNMSSQLRKTKQPHDIWKTFQSNKKKEQALFCWLWKPFHELRKTAIPPEWWDILHSSKENCAATWIIKSFVLLQVLGKMWIYPNF